MTTSLTSIRATCKRLTMVAICAAFLLSSCVVSRSTTGATDPERNAYSSECDTYSTLASTASELLGDASKSVAAGREVKLVHGDVIFTELAAYQSPSQQRREQQARTVLLRNAIAARSCYNQKSKEVVAQVDSGAMTRDEGQKRLKEILDGLERVKAISKVIDPPKETIEAMYVLRRFGDGQITKEDAEKRLRELHVEIHADLDQIRQIIQATRK